jgi:hypothetical protein
MCILWTSTKFIHVNMCDEADLSNSSSPRSHFPENTRCVAYIHRRIFMETSMFVGARGNVVGWGTMLQAGKSRVRRISCAPEEAGGAFLINSKLSRDPAQAVSHSLPTEAARVRSQIRSCGGRSGTETGFLPVLGVPLPILIPPTAPHTHTHHLSSGAGTIGQIVAHIPSGLSLTPPQKERNQYLHF